MATGVDWRSSDDANMARDERPNLPSHARRPRVGEHGLNGLATITRNVRGVVKGYKAAKKRVKTKTQKLPIQFSTRLGGAVGVNRRSFVDEIVVQMRKNAPLIGVETWKQVPHEKKSIIVQKVLDRWQLKDDLRTNLKILQIAGERYKNWRSNLAATYRAYTTDEERLQNRPEEIDMAQWRHLIYYFGTEKFKKKSETNAANRKKKRFNHGCGSKSFSQLSYENRDKETNEEPNDLELWNLTHCRNGIWLDSASKELYDNVCEKIGEKEDAIGEPLSADERNEIFQEVATGGFGSVPGRGYMAKLSNSNEDVLEQLKEQKEINGKLTGMMEEVLEKNNRLEAMLAEERETRAREIGSIDEKINECVRQQLLSAFQR